MIQKPFRGAQLNRTHPLAKGLVGCWLFNEMTGETVFDLSGNGNTGTLENGVAWGSDGLEFDGVDDYVDCGTDNIFNVGTSDHVFSGWVYPYTIAADDAFRYIAAIGNNDTGEQSGIGIRNAKIIHSAHGTPWIEFLNYTIPAANQWYHIAVVHSGLTSYLYINGELKDEEDIAINVKIGKCYIGVNLGMTSSFNGSIDSVRIYNRALSAEEVVWSYREPYAMFEPAFNPALLYSAAPPAGAIMNQFQRANIGADLYNGVFA